MSTIRSHPKPPWRAATVLLGGTWLAVLGTAPAAWAAQGGQPRVTVVVAPDVAGLVDRAGHCSGCDGQISTADALAGNAEPLPRAELVLKDGSGRELARKATLPEAFGSETATFAVAAPGAFTVELGVPAGWEPCPERGTVRHLAAADFGPSGAARVDFTLWRGCQPALARVAAADGGSAAPLPAAAAGEAAIPSPAPASPAPAAGAPGLPRTGSAGAAPGGLMLGFAVVAVACGLFGLTYETRLVRGS